MKYSNRSWQHSNKNTIVVDPMRPTIVAGNWKMFTTLTESAELVQQLKDGLNGVPETITPIVCPPFTSLETAGRLLKGSRIAVGAQNMSEHDEGAYTGEVSWKMIQAAGCTHVILGHSERRQYFRETNEEINRKAKKALLVGLTPIICVGEKLEEREKGITEQVITVQVKGVLEGLPAKDMANVTIAYEPVWAIGTGKNATPLEAQEVHKHIRKLVSQLHTWAVADATPILYGGSVKPDNASDLMAQDDIDGALVGGASLKAKSFIDIIKAGIRT
jgi:triosephosphate isomerase (TIM)